MSTTNLDTPNDFFESKVLGHPAGLFVLFFTEMWERFSYYGMRALLVLFLTSSLTDINPGWGWPRAHALAIYGSYTGLAYLTPILGGYIADRIIGYRWAVSWCLINDARSPFYGIGISSGVYVSRFRLTGYW